jgi:Leucine-rich repeat (LRR) protein
MSKLDADGTLYFVTSNVELHDAGFVGLTKLKRLIFGTHLQLTNSGLASLTTLTDLGAYSRACAIEDSGVSGLSNLTSLMVSPLLTNAGIRPLTKLKHLDIRGNDKIDSDGIQHLTNLTSLILLGRSYSFVGKWDEGVKRLPNLTELNIGATFRISSAGLREMTHLTSLDISRNAIIDDAAIACLVNLRSLKLMYNLVVTNDGISGLTNLTFLDLRDNRIITNQGLALLTNLTWLNLIHRHRDDLMNMGLPVLITEEGLRPLTKLKNLPLSQ